MTNMPMMCSMSRKNTVMPETIRHSPSARMYSMIMTGIRKGSTARLIPIPKPHTMNTTMKHSSMFTKQVVTWAMGSTWRGKWILVTMLFCVSMQVAPPWIDVENAIHGISATNRNR